jgi:hypothetical protein
MGLNVDGVEADLLVIRPKSEASEFAGEAFAVSHGQHGVVAELASERLQVANDMGDGLANVAGG